MMILMNRTYTYALFMNILIDHISTDMFFMFGNYIKSKMQCTFCKLRLAIRCAVTCCKHNYAAIQGVAAVYCTVGIYQRNVLCCE